MRRYRCNPLGCVRQHAPGSDLALPCLASLLEFVRQPGWSSRRSLFGQFYSRICLLPIPLCFNHLFRPVHPEKEDHHDTESLAYRGMVKTKILRFLHQEERRGQSREADFLLVQFIGRFAAVKANGRFPRPVSPL